MKSLWVPRKCCNTNFNCQEGCVIPNIMSSFLVNTMVLSTAKFLIRLRGYSTINMVSLDSDLQKTSSCYNLLFPSLSTSIRPLYSLLQVSTLLATTQRTQNTSYTYDKSTPGNFQKYMCYSLQVSVTQSAPQFQTLLQILRIYHNLLPLWIRMVTVISRDSQKVADNNIHSLPHGKEVIFLYAENPL